MSSVLTPGNISWTKFTSIASERSLFKALRFPHRRSLKTSFIQNWLLVFSVVGVILFPNRLDLASLRHPVYNRSRRWLSRCSATMRPEKCRSPTISTGIRTARRTMTTRDVLTFMISSGAMLPSLRSIEFFVQTDHRILAYWNYLPGIYFVKSHYNAQELTHALVPVFGDLNHIVVEVNSEDMDGRLPPTAWRWFYEKPDPKGTDACAAANRGATIAKTS
jgi:hypothetical protein